jgi:hypothetical protein
MKRIGYVGLSTPSFYDYGYQATKAPSDTSDSPNPIVEGLFGALLLYDEIWFLCRSLCPDNVRHLPYVKFLDEANGVPSVDPDSLPDPDHVFDQAGLEEFSRASGVYQTVRDKARVHWNALADNHTHGLQIGKISTYANSCSIEKVLFDMVVVDNLERDSGNKIEFITNSFTSSLFKSGTTTAERLELTEAITISNVPQYLAKAGPYHSAIDEVRESRYLKDFREWISTSAFSAGKKEIQEMRQDVEMQLKQSQESVLRQYLDPRGSYQSYAETVLGMGVDFLIPGVGAIKDFAKLAVEEKRKRGMRWQGFILDARDATA